MGKRSRQHGVDFLVIVIRCEIDVVRVVQLPGLVEVRIDFENVLPSRHAIRFGL